MPHLVVCYDVSDDRKRTRLCKFLKNFLDHVQKSVFEGSVPEMRVANLLAGIPGLIDPDQDTVRVYTLCARDTPRTEVIGTGIYVEDDGEDVIV